MKNYYSKIVASLLAAFFTIFVSCTDDFDEINTQPDALTSQDVTAKYFVTDLQQQLVAQNTYGIWLGNMLHPDLFSGHFAQGFADSDWVGDAGWTYNDFWQFFTYKFWADYNATLSGYLDLVKEGSPLENDQFYAIGLIMKGYYYQIMSDTYGMHPYSEASNPTIKTPKYDEIINIYKGIISDLDIAIDLIGSNTKTGEGVEYLSENDVIFNGRMQSWKKLANSIKLRLALRAHGAVGEDFSAKAASEAISSGVLADENALFKRDDNINMWVADCVYGDVVSAFPQSRFYVGESLINILQDNDDPRLASVANASVGGVIKITKPEADSENYALIDDHIAFLKSVLDRANATYTIEQDDTSVTITMPENTNYVGLPSRLSEKVKRYFASDLFSYPSDVVVQSKGKGKPIYPSIIMTAADSHLMVAEAIVKGLAPGDAAVHYQLGIEHAMNYWAEIEGVSVESSAVATYLSTNMGTLNGTDAEKLEKIATQRWIANYTNGYEAWAIVRDTGYPSSAIKTSDASNSHIIGLGGTLNGAYPYRLRYGSDVYGNNLDNTNAALSAQGPDVMATKLWWAK